MLVLAGVTLIVVLVIVVWRVPRSTRPSGFAASNQSISKEAAAIVSVQIDSIDATAGKVSARVSISAGSAVPAGGVKVLVGGERQDVVTVNPDEPSGQQPLVFDFDRGSVTSYPFDRYRQSLSVAALPATSSRIPGAEGTTTLPVQITGNSSAFGFSVNDVPSGPTDGTHGEVRLAVQRTLIHRIWASGMMAVDWALALTAVTVVLSVALRARSWETRHLAWLGSLIFALAAFRNTAPGGPPLGVFMDTAAFFWAEAVVVVCLVTLVVIYLSRPRTEID